MQDIIVISCTRPAFNTTVTTLTLPPKIVAMLQALSDNVRIPDPDNPGQTKPKYTGAPNVIFTDLMMLLPYWEQALLGVSAASALAQVQATQDSIRQDVESGVAAIAIAESQP